MSMLFLPKKNMKCNTVSSILHITTKHKSSLDDEKSPSYFVKSSLFLLCPYIYLEH
jgi:hypothetical protein